MAEVEDFVNFRVKRSLVTTIEPPAGSLPEGVLAVNIIDKKLWIGDVNGNPQSLGGAAAVASLTDLTPTAPVVGDFWYHTTLGKLYIYYNDGTSSQWVEIGPGVV